MASYAKLKKLDEKTLQNLKEGPGPADECLCSIFTPEKKSFAASVKKAFGFSVNKKKGGQDREIPFKFSKGASSKEILKRNRSCGKCGCDNENIVLKHSYANIRITTPDVTSFCPCPTDCLPDKDKMKNNIQVVVERADVQTSASTNVALEERIKDNSEEKEAVEKEEKENRD
ncbi:unnamed protein product [Colias eurytheme]|nr:unnamed protein product [Colias eurytheme]